MANKQTPSDALAAPLFRRDLSQQSAMSDVSGYDQSGYNIVQYAPGMRSSKLQRTFSDMGPGAQRASLINLVMTAMGSGVLALPWAFSKCGLPLGTVMLGVGAMASYQSLKLLANSGYATTKTNYSAVVESVLGPTLSAILQFILFFYAMGACISFFVFVGVIIPAVVEGLDGPQMLKNRTTALLVVAVFPVLPMAYVRRIGTFRYLSIFSIACIVGVIAFIISMSPFEALSHHVDMEFILKGELFSTSPSGAIRTWLSSCSIMIFSYCCHLNMFSTSFEMNDPTPRRVNKILARSVTIEFLIYLLVGAGGALSFGNKTDPVILANYPKHHVWHANIARCGVILALLVCIPVNLFAARGVLYDALASRIEKADWQPSFSLHVFLSTILVGLCVTVAIFEEDIVCIIGILGGGGAVTFMFVLPMLTARNLQLAGKFENCETIGRSQSRPLLLWRVFILGIVSVVGYSSAVESCLKLLGVLQPVT